MVARIRVPCPRAKKLECLVQRQPPVEGWARYLERPTDVHHGHFLVRVERFGSLNSRVGDDNGLPAAQPATSAGRFKTGPCAFLNQASLKLGQRRENVEDEFAGLGRPTTLISLPPVTTPLVKRRGWAAAR
jgi:hypothetical protein